MDSAVKGSGSQASMALENTFKKMKEDWKNIKFTFVPYKDTKTSILKSVDDIRALLEDHMVKTSMMKGSHLTGPLKDEINKWDETLNCLSSLVDSWVAVQAMWLYLEPIFRSDDLRKQLQKEGKMFEQVDQNWRAVMESAVKNPDPMAIVSQRNLLDKLQNFKTVLDEIQKGLNDYLESRRIAFPRFYFISNDDLLEILSEAKDPQKLQPHLHKCFEGIEQLTYSADKITGIESGTNEKLEFSKKISPADSKGIVEKLLSQVKEEMRNTVRDIFMKAIDSYGKTARSDWALQYPGQIALAASQVHWTAEATQAIQSDKLGQYAEKCYQQIQENVAKVRGSLSKNARITLETFITIDVHARDIVVALSQDKVKNPSAFKWIAQLRSYRENDNVFLRMASTTVAYDYEYLGNTPRLVITPLTDRCYITLMTATGLNLGGAPQGPAGTGKTETTKDLAKALGKYCIVVNCSDQLDYKCLGKLFKGAAQSGAWIVFDEFNRIDIEVLAVVAQQLKSIQRAKNEKMKTFLFEGSEIALEPSCGIFVTMNPGYAGRTELPEELKLLFRPVAMMVPDYALISEIMLYSRGFATAGTLAKKMVAIFKFCSEQLSSQDFYDYGMRAVKAVASTAADMKRDSPPEKEDVLLVRAICAICRARLVSEDVALFEGVLSDMFPGIKMPEMESKDLEAAVLRSIKKRKLQAEPYFVNKVLQVYQMMQSRHGVMLVGDPLSGKTTAYKVLADALTDLHNQGSAEGSQVDCKIINPKAVTLDEFYGKFDPLSQEWTDGVVTRAMRENATSTTEHRKWIILDGPVDAIWVENLNTVLDDNKKLLLATGESIPLAKNGTMIFEGQDCRVASPAFVSRNGMVYFDPVELGWQPLVKSWQEQSLPDKVSAQQRETIKLLFDWLMGPSLSFVKKECVQLINCNSSHLVSSMLKLYSCLIEDTKQSGQAVEQQPDTNMLISKFLFSVVWSVGGVLDESSRIKFDKFFRELCEMEGPKAKYPRPEKLKFPSGLMIPKKGLVYDHVYLSGLWNDWSSLVKPVVFGETMKINEAIVNTVETERQQYFLDLLTKQNKPLLLIGPTGTGKTMITNNYLSSLPRDQYLTSNINFSGHTSARQTRDTVFSQLEKKSAGVYGPAQGKRVMIFVDDVNMPAKEVYGAQPPIELLRQWLNHGFWNDRKDGSYQQIVDTSLLCAMGPPGGGRNAITERLTRHFNVISMPSFGEETMRNIFTPIMDWHFKTLESSQQKLSKVIVTATLHIYKKTMTDLLPTPTKPHYVFNLRDLARVIQGVTLLKSKVVPAGQEGTRKIVRLWIHEVYRVFYDRLVEDCDKDYFFQLVKSCTESQFGESLNNLFSHITGDPRNDVTDEMISNLMFGDYLNVDKNVKIYDEMQDLEKIKKTAEYYLEEYNELNKSPMNLVMFRYALQHVSRIGRVLKQPNGHCLLLGITGSGRQSAAKLAAFMSDLDLFSVEITLNYNVPQWQEDLRKVMRKAGVDGTPSVFLLCDNQIKNEVFLDDINMILNSGDVPNLFDNEERLEIIQKMKDLCKTEKSSVEPTPLNMYKKFIERVRCNLHVVLAFNPVDGEFKTRQRMRMFPSVINCCTIDYFEAWPAEALEAVANKYLHDVEMTDTVRSGTINMLKHFHQSISTLSQRLYNSMRRRNYVTPTSYLELIKTFKSLLKKKGGELGTLKNRYTQGLAKLNDLNDQIGKLTSKPMSELAAEKDRWAESLKTIGVMYDRVIGDVLLSAGVISYLGPFLPTQREDCLEEWYRMCRYNGIPVSDKYSLSNTLGEPVQIQDWQAAGLPVDSYSVDNAVIAKTASLWPLIIDHQGQANKWLRNLEKPNKLEVIRASDPNFTNRLENCIRFGKPCLIENVGEDLNPVLETILQKKTFNRDGVVYIRVGDHMVEYNPDFTLYMTTQLSNPQYTPENSVKMTILNFTTTIAGLQEQLLGMLVNIDRPDLKEQKIKNTTEAARQKQQLREQEDMLLKTLAETKGNILEDKVFFKTLSDIRNLSWNMSEKKQIAAKTEKEIRDVIDGYKPIAKHASVLFFTLSDLSKINPMYQFSLNWFVQLLHQSIVSCKPSASSKDRITSFTYNIYKNVCRSLFEKDKLIFSFLLCTGILKSEGKLDEKEWRFLLAGDVTLENPLPNPAPHWLPEKSWFEIVRCSELPAFKGLSGHVQESLDIWKKIYDSPSPQTEKLPEPWCSRLTRLEKLIVLKCLRSDKMVSAVKNFVLEEMGQQYIDPPTFDLPQSYKESSSSTPLIYILSQGADAVSEITQLAKENGRKVKVVVLGQGQGPVAEQAVREGAAAGDWVVLQDCRLSPSWFGNLERLCDDVITDPSKTKETFRLWLTSWPAPQFPISILQKGIKIIHEPPKGLKTNLLRAFSSQPIADPAFFSSCKKPKVFEKLLFGLCYYHAVMKERQKYGPLGTNIPYTFLQSDLSVSVQHLMTFLNNFDTTPLEAVHYLTAECSYGGHITDDKDRRLAVNLLKTYFCQQTIDDDNYKFSFSGKYFAPPKGSYQDYLKYIESLPETAEPEALGLPENADMYKDEQETQALLAAVLQTSPKQLVAGEKSFEDYIEKLAADILAKLPAEFNIDEAQAKYPTKYEDSLNTYLLQELIRFNRLTQTIRKSLQDTCKAVKGFIVMTRELREVVDTLIVGKVPQVWLRRSYPSMKSLGGYISNLLARLAYFRDWITTGTPTVHWFSAFFFPQAFLTSLLQNHARQNKITIDQLELEFNVMGTDTMLKNRPSSGAYVRGLYMEGARWCSKKNLMEESFPKVLHDQMPVIWFKPVEKAKIVAKQDVYLCPVYKTSARRGVLSTTGHSTNFVTFIKLPTDQPESHWIKRGVACLCQLDN